MIILTKFDTVNRPTDPPSSELVHEDFIGVDAWSVVTVEKFNYNGGVEGSKVFLGEGRGYVTVREVMTDVIHMIENNIKEKDNDEAY